MGTELPADRLHRRLGGEPGAETDPDGDDGRTDAALSRWLPDADTGETAGWVAAVRADPGRAGAIALGVVGLVAVLVTVFTLIRDKTPPVVSAKLPPVEMVSSAQPTPSGTSAVASDGPVVVSVVGLVHKPGLVTLASGARIADALTAAGGALDGADLMGLNMARRVADGEQIIVGIAAPPGEPPSMGSSVASPTADARRRITKRTADLRKCFGAGRFGRPEHRDTRTARHPARCRSGDRGGHRCVARRERLVLQRRPACRHRRYRSCAAGEAACAGPCVTVEDDRAARLDLRLVPAALTSWAVTAAGILWSVSGVVGVLLLAIAVAIALAWWGSGAPRVACRSAGGCRGHRRRRGGWSRLRRRRAAAGRPGTTPPDRRPVRRRRRRRRHAKRDAAVAGRRQDDVSRIATDSR